MIQRLSDLLRVPIVEQLQIKQWLDYLGKFTDDRNYKCIVCHVPVGMKGTSPAIQVGDRRNKKFKHSTCEGRINVKN